MYLLVTDLWLDGAIVIETHLSPIKNNEHNSLTKMDNYNNEIVFELFIFRIWMEPKLIRIKNEKWNCCIYSKMVRKRWSTFRASKSSTYGDELKSLFIVAATKIIWNLQEIGEHLNYICISIILHISKLE